MKKGLITLLMVCAAVSAFAVDLPKQGFGFQIGWAQPTLRVNDGATKDTLNHNLKFHGFKVGLVYDASYIAGFGSTIGLNYTFGAYNGSWKKTTMYNYPRERQFITYNELEIFVDWQYKFEIAKETYLMLYTGPTLQCGLALNWRKDIKTEDIYTGKVTTKIGDRTNAYKIDEDSPLRDNAFRRINITWGVGAGFQYQRYFIRGGYDFGLMVPYKNQDFSTGYHARGRLDQWTVKIGMYFWQND